MVFFLILQELNFVETAVKREIFFPSQLSRSLVHLLAANILRFCFIDIKNSRADWTACEVSKYNALKLDIKVCIKKFH